MDSKTAFEVRAYPIDEPMSNTLGFASVSVDGLAAIRGVRIIQGEDDMFVAMPAAKDKNGDYREFAFPNKDELRSEINAAVLTEYDKQALLSPEERGYPETDKDSRFIKNTADVKYKLDVYLVAEPKNGTQAFVNISLNDTVSINSARIVNGKKGMFLSMPQSKDKNGEFRDIAFPLNGDVRKTIAKDALTAFEEKSAMRESKKQGIGEKIAAGVEKAMQYTAAAPPRVAAVAKSSPGLGD